MSLYRQAEVQAFARTAGFGVADAKTAGAIAMVESQSIVGGTPYADSSRVGDQALVDTRWWYSYSLWQIRSLRADKATGRTRDQDRLPEPVFNAASAHTIWLDAGRTFTPWSTYNSGAYKAYLQDDYPPPPQTYIVIGGDTLSRIANTVSTRTGVAVNWLDLAKVNHIVSPYLIHPGDPIRYPWTDHTVAAGDTLSGITATYATGVTWRQVAAYNALANPDRLAIGQIIRLPRPELFS